MPPLRSTLDHLRRMVRPRPIRDTDRALLAAFAATRDETAFAELVRRHGALVRGVCRRVLGSDPAVDDAFQATFLLLAGKAGSGGWRDSVAGWLHATAWHVAQKARRAASRRQRHEASGGRPTSESFDRTSRADAPGSADPAAAAAWSELCQVLDQELARLPERLRVPLVLCYLEGRTRDEAAVRLGWPLGTLKHRLTRASTAPQPADAPRRSAGRRRFAGGAGRRIANGGHGGGRGPVGGGLHLRRSGGGIGGRVRARRNDTRRRENGVGSGCGITGRSDRHRGEPGASATGGCAEKKTPVAHAPGSPVAVREPLPPGAVARLGTLAFCHGLPVQQLLTSPDGRSIITIGGPARIWDAATGQEQGIIPAPGGRALLRRFAAAGRRTPRAELFRWQHPYLGLENPPGSPLGQARGGRQSDRPRVVRLRPRRSFRGPDQS